MCSECFEVMNCQCKFCDFEAALKDEGLRAKYHGCPDCDHTPQGFYNLEPRKMKNQPAEDYVEIIMEVSE